MAVKSQKPNDKFILFKYDRLKNKIKLIYRVYWLLQGNMLK